jgi:hypothetical protein
VHNPSQTKLILGAFGEDQLSDAIYAGQYNPGAYGNEFNDSYGFDITGHVDLEDWGVFHWEALGTRLGDFGAGVNLAQENFLLGGNVAFEFEGGFVKANFARVANESANGAAGFVGGVGGTNVTYGASGGWTPLQWVNPPGFFAAQRSIFEQANGGGNNFPNTVDKRPIPGWNSLADNAIGTTGNIGQQAMNSYGLEGGYKWDISDGDQVRIGAEGLTRSISRTGTPPTMLMVMPSASKSVLTCLMVTWIWPPSTSRWTRPMTPSSCAILVPV